MLTESFVAATRTEDKATGNAPSAICFHEFQPLAALKTTFKKSSSKSNCVAVSSTHIFASQADKAVINVYSRERNNLEATVPFPERITCLTLIGHKDGGGILALGTEGGRLILWEVTTETAEF